jgi:threonine/homoserine/homoserine lactone efflux protein
MEIIKSIISVFFKGAITGFLIAAPVGPIAILCIRRTLARGFVIGFASGLGAATADALYGIIASFGITVISNFLIEKQCFISFFGSIFLGYLGIKTLLTSTVKQTSDKSGNSILNTYASTLFLTLSNPITIIAFTAAFASLGITNASGNYLVSLALILGLFVGSTIWWLLLSSAVGLLRKHFNSHLFLHWINKISGILIIIFAIIILYSASYCILKNLPLLPFFE